MKEAGGGPNGGKFHKESFAFTSLVSSSARNAPHFHPPAAVEAKRTAVLLNDILVFPFMFVSPFPCLF